MDFGGKGSKTDNSSGIKASRNTLKKSLESSSGWLTLAKQHTLDHRDCSPLQIECYI